jgi:Uma2 family endonuclease
MFELLSEAGYFADRHVELLNGEIFVRGLQNPEHSYPVQNLSDQLHQKLGQVAAIRTQLPMVLLAPPPDFVEPDLAIVKLPKEQYKTHNATNSDALWVIEVSDSTLERDRKEKLEAYSRNAIPEYWILNVEANELEVYREPDGKNYLSKRILKANQAASPLAFPEASFEWWL